MAYTINYHSEGEFVEIKIKGKLNFDTVQKYSTEAIKIARRNNCNKFLLDHTGTALVSGNYKIHADGAELEQFGFKSIDKIAIVLSVDTEDNRLLKTAVYDVGWSNFRTFSTLKEAVLWLTEEE